MLLKSGSEVNCLTKNGQSPLHIACGKNKLENVKILISHIDIDVNIIDQNGFSPLLKSFSALSNDCSKFLIENAIKDHNMKLNLQDKNGYTALHYSMEDGNLALSLSLLKNGAKFDLKNSMGKVCFDLIEDKNMKNVLLSFIDNINNINL